MERAITVHAACLSLICNNNNNNRNNNDRTHFCIYFSIFKFLRDYMYQGSKNNNNNNKLIYVVPN